MSVDFTEFSRKMDRTLEHLGEDFDAVRAGRALAFEVLQPLASGHTVRAQKRSVVHAEQQSPRLEERIGEVE